MDQKQLIDWAIAGVKAKQIALTNSLKREREDGQKAYVLDGIRKALDDTWPIRRELEEMKEALENV